MSLKNWQEEKRSAWLYQRVASVEHDPVRRNMFLELSKSAEKQAGIWEKQGISGVFRPGIRARVVVLLLGIFGASRLRFVLAAMKIRGMSVYGGEPQGQVASVHLEQRHRGVTHAGNLRAAVFGVNDGLVSNLSLLAGVSGGAAGHSMILLTGVAGLLAGACSMASGEYISVRSQREFFEYQIGLEREELETYPEEEADELAVIYRARGLPEDAARSLADHAIKDPERALDTLAREELGLNPSDLGSPVGAAISSFVSFAMGAFVPLAPFFFLEGNRGLYCSFGLTAVFLAGIGALLSLFSNRGALFSGFRMLLVGSLAATLTFTCGHWLGGVLG